MYWDLLYCKSVKIYSKCLLLRLQKQGPNIKKKLITVHKLYIMLCFLKKNLVQIRNSQLISWKSFLAGASLTIVMNQS